MKRRAYGTTAISRICQVAPLTVGRWLEEGKIPFFTTGGGSRRVWSADLAAFLKSHNYPVPAELEETSQPLALIVDSSSGARDSLRKILADGFPGLRIEEAADGFEAGEKVAALKPALLLLNAGMPGMDGHLVCARIRRNPAFNDIKILMLMAGPSEKIRNQAIQAGADAFIELPFFKAPLLEIVRRLLPKGKGV